MDSYNEAILRMNTFLAKVAILILVIVVGFSVREAYKLYSYETFGREVPILITRVIEGHRRTLKVHYKFEGKEYVETLTSFEHKPALGPATGYYLESEGKIYPVDAADGIKFYLMTSALYMFAGAYICFELWRRKNARFLEKRNARFRS